MKWWDKIRRRKPNSEVLRDEASITMRRSFTLTIDGEVDPTKILEMTLTSVQGEQQGIERIAAHLRGEK